MLCKCSEIGTNFATCPIHKGPWKFYDTSFKTFGYASDIERSYNENSQYFFHFHLIGEPLTSVVCRTWWREVAW